MKTESKFPLPSFKIPLLIGIVTSVLTFILTSSTFITPQYKSETIIYVPLFVPARQMEQQGIGFASDKEIDGHIQILISGKMKDTLTNLFSLYDEYGINPNINGSKAILYRNIDKHIKVQKTRYSSVSITVENPDPIKAAKMANTLVRVGDVIKEDLLALNRRDAVEYASELVIKQENLMNRFVYRRDSLLAKNLDTNAIRVKLVNVNWLIDKEYQELIQKRDNVKREKENLNTPLPSSYVITAAVPGDSPIWPPRLLISLFSLVLSGGLVWLVRIYFQGSDKKK